MTTCTIHRWLWSRSRDAGRPAPAWSGRHMAGCPACREAVSAAVRLDGALRADARPLSVPGGFEVRVMAAVRTAEVAAGRPAAALARSWRRSAWAAAAACAAVALAYWGREQMEARELARAEARVAMSVAVAASDWIAAWGDASPDRLTGPMQMEVDNLVADARRAATALFAGLE